MAPEYIPAPKSSTLLSQGEKSLLQTAIADVSGDSGSRSARLLLDTGCSRSYVTFETCNAIDARCIGEEVISVAGFGDSKRKTANYKVFELDLVLKNGEKLTVTANGVKTISCPIQKFPIDRTQHPILSVVALAEPLVSEPCLVEIDLLIGGDYYYDIVGSEQIKCGSGLIMLNSALGYVLAGRIKTEGDKNAAASSLLLVREDSRPDSNFVLERFWRLEDIGVKDSGSADDEIALKTFNESVRFNSDKRYEVKWPWKENEPELPDNYGLALGRLKSLIRRIGRDDSTMNRYNQTIQDQLDKGIIEVAPDQPDGLVHYIPHHCVIRPDKATTKLRIVYDASCKKSRSVPSLNECIHRGPVMLEDLCGLLLRFRLHKVALVSDIEKAFLQVGLQTSERDVTRFLWMKDSTKPPLGKNLISYRFQRVPFGVIASPFLLAATVVYHLNRIGTPTAKKILKNIYVDNIITGTECTEEALLYYKDAKAVFSSASINLREWYSNDPVFIQSIPEEDRGKGTTSTILGMVWDIPKDTLSCSLGQLTSKSVINTKRLMLQSIAKLFDPCGFFSPIVVTGKLILQELWKKHYEWDEILPGELLQAWQNFYSEFVRIPELPIVRRFNGSIDNKSTVFELHCFCDASANAYAAVVYLRAAVNGEVQADLIFSKVRICPIKAQTIPRLEMMAVTIGSRILEYVENQLQLVIGKKFLWSDSQCTLHWILGKEVSTTFVRNRVREIKKHPDVELRYVPTEANPADIPSRGVGFEYLKESTLWWHGPKWLWYCTELWSENPIQPGIRSVKEIDSSQEADTCFPVSEMESAEKGMDVRTFSSLRRLLRVTAWMRRFTCNASKLKIRSGPLSTDEILEAKIVWEKQIQEKYFSNVLSEKKRGGIARRLGLFRDPDGMLRCSGRFDAAELAYFFSGRTWRGRTGKNMTS